MRQGWTGRTPGPRGSLAVHSGCDGQPWRALTRERQDWICGLEGALLLPRVGSICSIVSGSCGHCEVFVKTLPSPALPHPPLIPSSLFPVLSSPIHSPRGQSTPRPPPQQPGRGFQVAIGRAPPSSAPPGTLTTAAWVLCSAPLCASASLPQEASTLTVSLKWEIVCKGCKWEATVTPVLKARGKAKGDGRGSSVGVVT